MSEIDTDERRAGTAVTFTGKGSREGDLRRRFVMIVPGIATLCVLSAAVWYLSRPAPMQTPPPAPMQTPPPAPMQTPPPLQPGPLASSAVPVPMPSAAAAPDHPLDASPAVVPAPAPSDDAPAGSGGGTPSAAAWARLHRAAAGTPAPHLGGPSASSVPAPVPEHARPRPSEPDASARPVSGAPTVRFHVQAGTFADRANAVALVTQLRRRGYAAALVEGPLYRVWVGGYVDRDTAEQLIANLRSDGFDAALAAQ